MVPEKTFGHSGIRQNRVAAAAGSGAAPTPMNVTPRRFRGGRTPPRGRASRPIRSWVRTRSDYQGSGTHRSKKQKPWAATGPRIPWRPGNSRSAAGSPAGPPTPSISAVRNTIRSSNRPWDTTGSTGSVPPVAVRAAASAAMCRDRAPVRRLDRRPDRPAHPGGTDPAGRGDGTARSRGAHRSAAGDPAAVRWVGAGHRCGVRLHDRDVPSVLHHRGRRGHRVRPHGEQVTGPG